MCESVFVHACLFGGNDPLPLGSYWVCLSPTAAPGKNRRCITDTHAHTHTPCAVSLFPLLCSNCLPPAFSISHTLPCSSPYYLLQSHTLFSSYFTPFSIFPPTCVAICLLMMQLEHQCQLPASDGERERSVVVVYMPCFVPLPLISPPLCLCCFPQSWPMRAACGLSAAVSFREEPNMWEDVCWRLCMSRWVPTLSSLSLPVSDLPLSSSVSVLSGAVKKMTYVKVLQTPLGPTSSYASVSLCGHAVWRWIHASLAAHVLKQGYRLRLPHFRIELFSRASQSR